MRLRVAVAPAVEPLQNRGYGVYERHVKRLRRENERRLKALLNAVSRYMTSYAQVSGEAAGLHVVLLLPGLRQDQEAAVVDSACEAGVGVYPLSPLYAKRCLGTPGHAAGLVLGYASLSAEQIDAGVRSLGKFVAKVSALPHRLRVE